MNKNECIENIMDLINKKQYSEALEFIEQIPQNVLNCWEIQNLIGLICIYCEQYKEAIVFFRKSLKLNANNPEIYYNLAYAYSLLKDYDRAELMLKCSEYITSDENLLNDISIFKNDIHEALSNQNNYNIDNSVLMIAYYFLPLAGSGVFRSIKFAKYLPQFNWKPTVISTDIAPNGWNFTDESLNHEISEDIDVIRIPDYISTGRNTEINVEETLQFIKNILQHDKKAIDIFQAMITSVQGIKQFLTFPCSSLIWSIQVVKYIEENVDLNETDVIYTTSGPYSSHIVGFYFKKKYNIPWVADYRDPWASNPYSSYDYSNPIHNLLFRLENILLHQADCNITIVDSLIDDYKIKFNLNDKQIECITNGYDETDFNELIYNKKTEYFTINYSGLMYLQQHNITPVLKALKELISENRIDINNLKLRIVGKGHEKANLDLVKSYGLENTFEQTGYVTHKEALQSNLDSDLLLILVGDDKKFKYFYPGKIFEYLRSGKPIIALASQESGVAKILSETQQGEVFLSTQIREIKSFILKEYQKWVNRNETECVYSDNIKVYERRYLTAKLADILFEAKSNPCNVNEINEDSYNHTYSVSGGCNGTYHKHYTQCIYYNSWKHALDYMLLMNRNAKILEIGCGPGQFANFLFDNGFLNYKGFDYAAEGIELAKKNNIGNEEKFFVADAFITPELEENNDLIICFEVLEHIQKDIQLLNRIPKGTKLLISVPNFDDPYHVRYFSNEQEVYDHYHETINIYKISKSMLSQVNCLYYIIGEKR